MALRMAKLWMIVLPVMLHGVTATNFCEQVVEPIGYGCTEYSVQTDDGFVLVMHRLGRIDSVLVRDGHTGAAHPPVDSGNNIIKGKDKPQRGGQRVECASPGSSIDPGSRTVCSSGDGNGSRHDQITQGTTSSASDLPSQMQAPAAHGSRLTADRAQPPSAHSSNGTNQDGILQSQATGTTPAPERPSRSTNGTSEDSSSEQAAVSASPAPSNSTQNASTSAPPPTTRSSQSNYTASPGVRIDSSIAVPSH
jgi:hypothetical protein